MELNYKKMIEDIVPLVENDFCYDMEGRTLGGEFTQKEAKEMARLLGQIYSIAHCNTCKSCQTKYLLSPTTIK